jgi:hypothetical protein
VEKVVLEPKILHGWYCSECDAIYLNPDDDTEHEDLHQTVEVIDYNKLKEWIQKSSDNGITYDDIITAILNDFQIWQ